MTNRPEQTPRPEPRRRRRIDEVFGDVLPETTSDEREPEWPRNEDEWYRANRPPHHDREQ